MNPINVKVKYFAAMREIAGKGDETLSVPVTTPRELYHHIDALYNFNLETDTLKVAVNDSFSNWEATLSPDDEVVFITPVAGG